MLICSSSLHSRWTPPGRPWPSRIAWSTAVSWWVRPAASCLTSPWCPLSCSLGPTPAPWRWSSSRQAASFPPQWVTAPDNRSLFIFYFSLLSSLPYQDLKLLSLFEEWNTWLHILITLHRHLHLVKFITAKLRVTSCSRSLRQLNLLRSVSEYFIMLTFANQSKHVASESCCATLLLIKQGFWAAAVLMQWKANKDSSECLKWCSSCLVFLPLGEEADQWLCHHLDHPPLLRRGRPRRCEHSEAHSAKWIQGMLCKTEEQHVAELFSLHHGSALCSRGSVFPGPCVP